MGSRLRTLMLLTCCALVTSGCITIQAPRNPFASLSKKSSEKAEKPDDKLKSDEKSKSGDELFASKSKSKSSETSKADAKRDSSTKNGSRKTPANRSRSEPAEHDPETLALIERELQDATPEERAHFEKDLQGSTPDMVRLILKSRRMGLNYQQQQLANAAPRGARPEAKSTDPALARTDRGLGASTPWGQSAGQSNSGQPNSGTPGRPGGPEPSNVPAGYERAGSPSANLPAQQPDNRLDYRQDNRVDPAGGYPGNQAAPHSPQQSIPNDQPGQAAGLGSLNPGQYAANNVQRANHNAGRPAVGPAGAADLTSAGGFPADNRNHPQSAWHEYVQRLVAATEAEVATMRPGTTEPERQAYTEKQVYLRMLYLMSGQQERALQGIPGLEPADQEFWQQTFWGIANYFDATSIPLGPDRATQTVSQFTTAVLRLQEKANLELRNATFCQKISSFGSYERFPRDEFSPGQQVLLYAEVINFHSEPTADGQYRTILKSNLEIRKPGPQGELIEQFQFPATEDVCRNHRRDYFHSYDFIIPAKVPLGPHVLKLTVEDQLSRKVATYSLNFTVK